MLSELETEGEISCVKPRSERKVQNGEVTFGEKTVVTFPQKGKK